MEKEKLTRMNELYENAVSDYLNSMDIDIVELMEEDDKREYQKLHFLMDSQCVVCGNPETMYECPDIDCEFYEAHEFAGDCKCDKKLVVDKDYHKSC